MIDLPPLDALCDFTIEHGKPFVVRGWYRWFEMRQRDGVMVKRVEIEREDGMRFYWWDWVTEWVEVPVIAKVRSHKRGG